MKELKQLIEDHHALDKKIEELTNKIHIKLPDSTEIEKKKQDISIDMGKLVQLQEKNVSLFNDVSNKSKNDPGALAELKSLISRSKNV
ncbi:MAG: hypothetical protein WCE94_08775 [Candidatus Methanoperedens sp.]|jgi:hypothetical protein